MAGVERFELSPHGFGDQQATTTTYPYITGNIKLTSILAKLFFVFGLLFVSLYLTIFSLSCLQSWLIAGRAFSICTQTPPIQPSP